MTLCKWFAAGLVLTGSAFLILGCRGTGTVRPALTGPSLDIVDSLKLAGPAVAICRDGDGLVVLESSGTRLLRFDANLSQAETIPLTRRLAAPRGVAADRFYFYVYDDNILYRMLKDELVLKSWVANIRVAGLAGYSAGEMLVSDGERGVVWYKSLFGESRRFLDVSTVSDPGPMVVLPDRMFCVLSGSNRLVYFNRAGIVVRTVQLSKAHDLVATDGAGGLYLLSQGRSRLLVVKRGGQVEFELAQSFGPVGMAVYPNRIAILDRGNRIHVYRLNVE